MTALSLGDEICTYLQGRSIGLNFNGAGTINCFSSLLPDQPDLGVAIIERGGLGSVLWLTGPASSTPGRVNESHLEQPVFQVFVRSGMTGYTAGNSMVWGVFGQLQGITEQTLNTSGALFHLIVSLSSPMYLGRDEKERHQWTVSFGVQWENKQWT